MTVTNKLPEGVAQETNIAWTNATRNPLVAYNLETEQRGHFCIHDSAGCKNCYAASQNLHPRFKIGTGLDFIAQNRSKVRLELHEPTLLKMLKDKRPGMVFLCSMTDLFYTDYPDSWIDRLWATMALTPWKTYQVLTKRAERLCAYLNDPDTPGRILNQTNALTDQYLRPLEQALYLDIAEFGWPLKNVWVGVSAEDQPNADRRIPHLLATPAALRWVSYEPALGPVNFDRWFWKQVYEDEVYAGGSPGVPCDVVEDGRIKWIVTGGESGSHARPFDIQWAQDTIRQGKAASVPIFVKQMGSFCIQSEAGGSYYDGKNFIDGYVRRKFSHPKGGEMSEWETGLQVREYPHPC